MENGYIKLSRKFFSNEMWNEARTFSSCEAWLDLIQSARFEATPRMESIGGREVSYTRGQYPASIRFLSKRWHWSEQSVRSFLNKLKRKGMISTDRLQGMNVITLLNYEKYNNTVTNTAGNTDNSLNINDIQEQVTQQVTQQLTQYLKSQHTGNTNSNKGEEYIIPPYIPPKGEMELEKKKRELEEKEAMLIAKEQELLKKEAALKNKNKQPEISFVSNEFKDIFLSWLEYKQQRKESYKSDKSLRTCYKKLLELSGNDPEKAKMIVEQSMANNWAGLFELKQNHNGNSRSSYTSKQEANDYAMQQYLADRAKLEQGIHDEIPKPF